MNSFVLLNHFNSRFTRRQCGGLFSVNLYSNFPQLLTILKGEMIAEAAVLGTPSIRFNDFAGKLGYLEELEHKYGLTYGIKTSEPEKLYQKIEELLNTPDLKEEWKKRRQKMLSEKIDVTAFMVWFIENYPESVAIMKKNPDYQYKFQSADYPSTICQSYPG